MKLSVASVATVLALAGNVSAHYIFQQLTVGSTQYPVFQYIRRNSNFNHPVTDLTSNDLRCNVGATGAGTETVAVRAGDQITFTLDTAVYHQGPISVYMSKAPSTAASYAGDGGWFKIRDIGPTFSGGSVTWPLSLSYTFNLPTCITNGEYLLRIQNLGIHNPWPAGIPQFYISCAQISVSGGGSVNPTNTVLIPGAFKETDPGYTANIYSGLTSYTVPGPAVFSCSGSPPSSPPPTTSPPPTSPPPSTSPPTTPPPTVPPPTAPPPSAPCAALWGQCGGQGWSGATCCSAGTCKAINAFYSQCVN